MTSWSFCTKCLNMLPVFISILCNPNENEQWPWHTSLRESQHILILVGGFNPSEKYESQLGLLFPIYGTIKHVPNHQPGLYWVTEATPWQCTPSDRVGPDSILRINLDSPKPGDYSTAVNSNIGNLNSCTQQLLCDWVCLCLSHLVSKCFKFKTILQTVPVDHW